MNAHLLINVFVTPVGLNKFRIDKVMDSSSTFRIDRFLTACSTFNSIPWKSVAIYLKLDPSWSHLQSDVNRALMRIFPTASIHNHRIESRSEWEMVSQKYPDEDSIFLQANDDHAVVCQDPEYLKEFIQTFCQESYFEMAALTHFPEMQTLISKKINSRFSPHSPLLSGKIHYAIGTQLIKSSFFKQWWLKGKIQDETYIFRPDNPFGESVIFNPIEMLIPQKELFRHMDGYGHIGMHRPLGPLRNLGRLADFINPNFQIQKWDVGLWPARIRAYSGTGSDLHDTFSQLDGFSRFRVGVALLQSHWSLKYMPNRARCILASINIKNGSMVFVISFIATLTLPMLRNVPDYFIERFSSKLVNLFAELFRIKKQYIPSYLGAWRTVRKRFLTLRKHLNF